MCLHPKCIKCEDINRIRDKKKTSGEPSITGADSSLTPLRVSRPNQAKGTRTWAQLVAGACWETVAQVESSALHVGFPFHFTWKEFVDLHAHQQPLVFSFQPCQTWLQSTLSTLIIILYYQYLASMMFHLAFFSHLPWSWLFVRTVKISEIKSFQKFLGLCLWLATQNSDTVKRKTRILTAGRRSVPTRN